MKAFLKELRIRNEVLYWYGWSSLAGAILCLLMTQLSDTVVMGISAWIKPGKFYISIAIFCWTMGWYMRYLEKQRKVRVFSWMVFIVMTYELFVITWQAANGRLSHFNISTPLYQSLYTAMGIAISLLVAWTGYIGYLFFRQKQFNVPVSYIWGIRLGIILFVIFSFEGGIMASRLAHTVGAPDGGPGLPLVNWSKHHGDLRVAHFVGVHALQLLPLIGFFVVRNKRTIQIMAIVYFLVTAFLFTRAIMGMSSF